MIQIPELVQDAPLSRMTNAVYVGLMKFTIDQFYLIFPEGSTPPARLGAQLGEAMAAYRRLNDAFALTRESLITQDIYNLDNEGDQLYLGWRETIEGARRMTYLLQRKQAGDRLWVFNKKYKIDVKENMISEWSKIQQMCEEGNASDTISADIATLGLTDMWARLTAIADELREKLTERSMELPSLKVMKQARAEMDPEYKTLIDVLNAYAMTDSDVHRYETLITTLNRNIDYVKIHAITKSKDSDDKDKDDDKPTPKPDEGGDDGGGDGGGEGGGDDGGDTPEPTPDPTPTPDPDPSDDGDES